MGAFCGHESTERTALCAASNSSIMRGERGAACVRYAMAGCTMSESQASGGRSNGRCSATFR